MIETLEITDYLGSLKPPVKKLYGYGDPTALEKEYVAIVGTRNLSEAGESYAKEIAGQIVEAGYGIVSGLALGADTAGHKGCLAAGGTTVAVIGSGIRKLFPTENRRLAREIVDSGGLILSEFDSDEGVKAWQLIQRNRLIVGLAKAVVIIETGCSGGTVYSARDALRQGKPVFVSDPDRVRSEGGDMLVQKPAHELPGLSRQFEKGMTNKEKEELSQEPIAEYLSSDLSNLLGGIHANL